MSGVVLGAAITGGLRAASGITGVLNIIVMALDSFAPARASKAFNEGGRKQLQHFIVRLAGLMGVLTLGTVVVLNVAPELAIRLLYGEKYEGLGFLVRWLCVPAVLYSMAAVLAIAAAAMERTKLIFQSYVAATVFTLIAAYPLAYYTGLPGIVVTWIVVECIRVAASRGATERDFGGCCAHGNQISRLLHRQTILAALFVFDAGAHGSGDASPIATHRPKDLDSLHRWHPHSER
jgi:O-antigen/teichoic acid export membrane protein